MTKAYTKRLIELATKLDITLNSQENITDLERYTLKIKSDGNHLVGYIMALKEAEGQINED